MTKAVSRKADGTWTPQGCKKVREMASARQSQATIASAFGLTRKTFENDLNKNKGANDVRLAWEAGNAEAEQRHLDNLFSQAEGTYKDKEGEHPDTGEPCIIRERTVSKLGGSIAIFLSKAVYGLRETDQKENANVTNINLTMPHPLSEKDYYSQMGIKGPVIVKDVKALPPPSDAAVAVHRLMAPPTPEGKT